VAGVPGARPYAGHRGSAIATIDILKNWGARRINYVGIIAAA
jgi:hypothetical protein